MKRVKMNNRLFNEQGCLSGDAVSRYIDRNLNSTEMAQVRDHAEICDLCRSALEGAVHFKSGKKFTSIISEIHNHRFSGLFQKERRGKTRRHPGQSSVFASIVIITGVLFIIYFYRLVGDKLGTDDQTLKNLPPVTDTSFIDSTKIQEPDADRK